eukprot:TRINITY_DN62163_c0_g1_i1.p1 TRINITY_DN62163_c0_g1~~TRINITY_DN62163_c0_g1_i1.p1  ORF type:complete len:1087 (-),score=149.53 TRINITY_DN62163_c0_g1_i1:130-3285(-)
MTAATSATASMTTSVATATIVSRGAMLSRQRPRVHAVWPSPISSSPASSTSSASSSHCSSCSSSFSSSSRHTSLTSFSSASAHKLASSALVTSPAVGLSVLSAPRASGLAIHGQAFGVCFRHRPLPRTVGGSLQTISYGVSRSSTSSANSRDSNVHFTTASEVLRTYARFRQEFTMKDRVESLRHLEKLAPSVYDERLQGLVNEVVSERENLSLSALVDVSRVLQSLGFQKELGYFTVIIAESASFLSSDDIARFAKTLAMASRASPESADIETRATVFRILGEHIVESMFEASPVELSESLLAIAVFYCSRGGCAPDPAVAQQWHHDVFASCATLLAAADHASFAGTPGARALVKCIRAYKLYLLSVSRRDGTLVDNGGPLENLPTIMAGRLVSRVKELSIRDVVRSLHSLAVLHGHGVRLDSTSAAFCVSSAEEIVERAAELDIRDVAFALQSLSLLSGIDTSTRIVGTEVLRSLYGEIRRLVSSLRPHEAIMIARAARVLAAVERPGLVIELLAAELLRDLRSLKPAQLCNAVTAFAELPLEEPSLFVGIGKAFASQLPTTSPRQVAVMLHSLAKIDRLEEDVCSAVAPHIVRDLLGFSPRDISLSLWAFAKVSYRDVALFAAVQEDLQRQDLSGLKPVEVSMLLWSFARADIEVSPVILSALTHNAASNGRDFPRTAILVTCIALARMGFAQQPFLVELYRSLYAQLPRLRDSQLAFGFFLFSTSGVRDEAILQRFLFECKQRLPRLRGQDLGNVVLACSRTVTPEGLAEHHGMKASFKDSIFGQLEHLGKSPRGVAPLLSIYTAAPSVLALSKEENLRLANSLTPHIPALAADGRASDLARGLLATSRAQLVHKPLLLPMFMAIRRTRKSLVAEDVVSCIWSVYNLGFCKKKFRRTLGSSLLFHVKGRRIAPRTLRDILPALSHFGFWERLPAPLRRSVWRLASEKLRQGATPPPPEPPIFPREEKEEEADNWLLPRITKGFFRKRIKQDRHVLNYRHQIESLAPDPDKERAKERKEEREFIERTRGVTPSGRTAVEDFVALVKRL